MAGRSRAFPPRWRQRSGWNWLAWAGSSSFDSTTQCTKMYWLSADPTERLAGGAWTAYVRRSCSEVAKGFDRLVATTDFSVVVRELPSDLRDKATADGVDPTRVLVFVAYFVTEQAFVGLSVTKR
jgi:hypothetical protein